MTAAEYFAAPGLSQSMLKDLEMSPLHFWHKHLNPKRPAERVTDELVFGNALHCAVLEPDAFEYRYARELHETDYRNCLVTMDDMRQWLKDKGHTPRGTKKADLIAQVQFVDAKWPIFEVLQAEQQRSSEGKTLLSRYDWDRLGAAAHALRIEPIVHELLERRGDVEVPLFRRDERTGVMLKGRLDYVLPDVTLDLKTFSVKRAESVDKAVTDAIYYEKYYRQAVFYAMLRDWPRWPGKAIYAFVQSDPPHETRIRTLVPKVGGEVNVWWETARHEIRCLIERYADCVEEFGLGEKPWRHAQEATPVDDADMRKMTY